MSGSSSKKIKVPLFEMSLGEQVLVSPPFGQCIAVT